MEVYGTIITTIFRAFKEAVREKCDSFGLS